MRKKIAAVIITFLVLLIMFAIYYFTPKTFGKGVDPSSVDHINIFDGNTGEGFTVDNAEDIKYIVENLQSKPMRRGGISLGRMGYKFSVSIVDSNDKAIVPIFFINNDNAIRKDPFFYYCDGGLCFDYLTELENKIVGVAEQQEEIITQQSDTQQSETQQSDTKTTVSGSFTVEVRDVIPDYCFDDVTPNVAVVTEFQSYPFTMYVGEEIGKQLEAGQIYVFTIEPIEVEFSKEYLEKMNISSLVWNLPGFEIKEFRLANENEMGLESLRLTIE